jgi:class 3 adenylate cyclase/WD40 repeat protein
MVSTPESGVTGERPRRTGGLAAYGSGVGFLILGPVSVLQEDEPVRLGGPKQRTVLALLLAEAGRTVSTDSLVEWVWGDEATSGSRSTLQSYMSTLRPVLGERLISEAGGYRLEVPREEVDAFRFEDMVAQARSLLDSQPAEAAELLSEALALWRGHPYADVEGSLPLEVEARRLEQLRLGAVEDRVEAELALGRHSELLPELEVLTAEFPLSERFRAQHMLALYRAGRQSEALRAYQKTRLYLAEEMGIDPSPALQSLEQRILDHDPTLEAETGARVQTVAFLFTDIEGSTMLWELHPGEMPEVLARHDRILNQAVEQAGGRVFNQAGDGVCAAFSTVGEAVTAARSAQEALAEADWGETGLSVRMAVDVGEVESRGDDYFGPPLNRCSRILAAGHGGQVLMSEDAHTVLSADAGGGWQVRSLGEHRFKGLGRPEHVFQLVVEGHRHEFPSLRIDRLPPSPFGAARSVRGYELRERVGAGDFGIVYRGYQPSVGREVAVKVIRPEFVNRAEFVRRFEAEAHLVALLEHPHIVPLYDYWRDPDGAYLVTRWLRGGSLRETLDRGPWNPEPAGRLIAQVGAALSYAHRRGVVHRDVKPANVLLDEDGNGYLGDFGIASRLTEDNERTPISSSPAYLAPEELRGDPLSPRSDIYSLGLLTFELLSGTRPPMDGELPAVSSIRPGIPAAVDEVIARARADDPAERYDTAEGFLEALSEALGRPTAPEEVAEAALTAARNPYKGLQAFQESDAADFYGRAEVVDELLAAVSSHRVVAVVGPSGIGKSSVVRAGLVPALRGGALGGNWLVTDLYPGNFPFDELAAALLRVAVRRPPRLVDDLVADERGLLRSVKEILPSGSRLLLVIDQFEELFTLTPEEDTRRRFLDNLVTLARDERSPVTVVVTLRADFLDRPLRYPEFGDLLGSSTVMVAAPSPDELAEAIARPAENVGVGLEPGLAERIAGDVADQPGALPLLQYSLTELFERRGSDRLSEADYLRSGGVVGALGRRADDIYQRLDHAGQEAARQVFLRLVTVDEAAQDTRRRVARRELRGLPIETAAVDQVLDRYGEHRLLTFDRHPTTRAPTVEVAHEALLTHWDRLRGWIDERREDLLLHRRLAEAATEWEGSGKEPSYLLGGGRLEQFETLAASSDLALSGDERDLIETSRIADDTQRNKRRRRRQGILAGFGVAALVSLAAAGVAFTNQQRASDEADRATQEQARAEQESARAEEEAARAEQEAARAEQEAREATGRELAGESVLALEEDPELAILLGLEAAEVTRSVGEPVLPEAIGAMQGAVQASRLELRLEGGAGNLAVSPQGEWIAADIADFGPDAVVWDASGVQMTTLPGPGGGISGIAANPRGSLVALSYNTSAEALGAVGYDVADRGDHPAIIVFDPAIGAEVTRVPGPPAAYFVPAFSPDGELLAAGLQTDEGSRVTVWEVGSGRERFAIEPEGGVGDIAFIPGGATLAVLEPGAERVGFYSAVNGDEVGSLDALGFQPNDMALDPSGERLALGAQVSRELQVWDLVTRRLVLDETYLSETSALNWSLDGHRLAFSGNQGIVTLVDPETGDIVMELSGSGSPVFDLAFLPGTERLVNVALDGVTRVWDVSADGPPEWEALATRTGTPNGPRISPDGSQVAVTTRDPEGFELLDTDTGQTVASLTDINAFPFGPVVSPDWRYLGSLRGSEAAARATIRDLASPQLEVLTELPPCTSAKAFSPDSSLVLLNGIGVCNEDPPPRAELRSRVIRVESGREVLDLGGKYVYAAVFNPSGEFPAGRYLAVTDNGPVNIYDLEKGENIATLDVGDMGITGQLSLSFDPQGGFLAGGTIDGIVWVLDFAAVVAGAAPVDALVFNQVAHTGPAPTPAITKDGILATAGFDSLVRLWDMDTDELIVEFRPVAGQPQMTLSPDGSYVLYADGPVLRRFYTEPERLIELAESRITRELTPDECRRYLDPETCP